MSDTQHGRQQARRSHAKQIAALGATNDVCSDALEHCTIGNIDDDHRVAHDRPTHDDRAAAAAASLAYTPRASTA